MLNGIPSASVDGPPVMLFRLLGVVFPVMMPSCSSCAAEAASRPVIAE
jgi:hypothetical protein